MELVNCRRGFFPRLTFHPYRLRLANVSLKVFSNEYARFITAKGLEKNNMTKKSSQSEWTAARLKCPVLAVDAIIQFEDGSIVFVKRKNPPFQDWWALPGGTVEIGETVEQALRREAEEETGLQVDPVRLVGVFSDPTRDPRGHTVSIGFLAQPIGGELHAATDAAAVNLFKQPPEKLAFDHRLILEKAMIFAEEEPRNIREKGQ